MTSFSTALAFDVMQAACREARLSSNDATLMRFGENALYHLETEGVVVRIARTMDYWADAVNEVNVARWLSEEGIPAAEVHDTPQPLAVADCPVTFWRFIPGRAGGPEDIRTLGTMLRRLHGTPRPTTFELPQEDILGRVASRIEVAPVSAEDKTLLRRRLQELSGELARLDFPLSPAPTHGDAQSENLMIRPDGRAVLIDFERFAWGQPEWDLSMTATEYLTAGWWTDDQYKQFVDAYGYDVTTWQGFDVLQAVHELKMTTWLMQNVEESQEIADEHQVRMRTIRGEGRPGWRPF